MAGRHSVVGAFADEQQARLAIRELHDAGVQSSRLRLVKPDEEDDPARVAVLRAELRDERHVYDRRFDRLFIGTFAGGVVGLMAGVLSALWGGGPLDPALRSVIVFVPFVVAGATVGVFGPMPRKPNGFHLAAVDDTIVAVQVADERTMEHTQLFLEKLGAERVEAVSPDGTPLER